jgi:hypothetical protein
MHKPEGFDSADTREGGFREPPAGPCIMGIVRAVAGKSNNQNDQLVFDLDIAEGAFKNHYREKGVKFNGNFYLRHYQGTDGKSLPYFKGLIKAIEESNPGYKFDFNEGALSRKLIGANLREEEYVKKSDGSIATRLKPAYLCSVESIRKGGHKVLPLKKLPKHEPGVDEEFAPPPPDEFDQRPPQDDLLF